MTSRPTLGHRQPVQRSLSTTTNVIQRPQPHRTLSQQFSSTSPARRSNDSFVDLTFDGSDVGQERYGPIPKMSSQLRLEILHSNNIEMVHSPKTAADLTPTQRPVAPPRGRPQLHFDTPNTDNLSPCAAPEGSQNESAVKPMPLPIRPGQYAPSASGKVRVPTAVPAKRDARPKPYTLEVPAIAPRYPPNGHVDFFPWTGNHPEDQFSETIIRQGYFDKAQMTQNETGSARASIFPAMKHKSGLQTLSSIFTSVLAQRRSHGQITTSSTFKPPPRVTVTDTKREMWLKDLANPTIPLRRLSRSIPHGIRGKVLLDQSMSKNIPIERAVWLAKCVGANELRSFRRKGVSGTFVMGGEAKWIRDFTVCVEQFVESIAGSCGEGDFKGRINYAIRLAAHFHAEHLLDREHYMDWLVTSLENSPQAKLPMWILVTQIYWKDLVLYRKYGRRLSGALLNHYSEIQNNPDRDILAPLADRLHSLLKSLMTSDPDGFVSPKVWAKHREIIQSSLVSDDSHFQVIFKSINRRNNRISFPGTNKEPTARQRLIHLLDTTLSGLATDELPKQCWRLHEDKAMVLRTVLEWSISSYRPGISKIYVAARIFRYWSRSGIDTTEAILTFLDSGDCEAGLDKSSFYHLVSELVRSKHFATARYMQWLIARGGFQDPIDATPKGPCAARLLAELPTLDLSEGILSLQKSLLSRVNVSMDEEEGKMNDCMASMSRALPGMQTNNSLEMECNNVYMPKDIPQRALELSRSSMAEIGVWLRHKVRLQMQQPTVPPLRDWDSTSVKSSTSAISPSDFFSIRHYLEVIEDYSMLADVLKITASSSDPEVLASCSDTLNLHLEIFDAIGALHGLFEALVGRLRALSEDQDSFPRLLLVSLADLAQRLPAQKGLAVQLTQELLLSDRKNATDACSPVSDHIALTQTSEDFTEEIEKILASGNSMDQATLDRMFQRVVQQVESSPTKLPGQQREYTLLLTKLRPFDVPHFDSLISAWITRFVLMRNRPSLMTMLGPMVSFGCISLHAIVKSCEIILEKDTSLERQSVVSITQELLVLLIESTSPSSLLTVEEAYRFRIKQVHMQQDCPLEVLASMRRALAQLPGSKGGPGGSTAPSAIDILESQISWQLLQRYSLLHTDLVTKSLVMPLLRYPDSVGSKSVMRIVDKLLRQNSEQEITTETILDIADDLTLPYCQIKLESMFTPTDSIMTGMDDVRSEHLQAFDIAIETAVNSGKTAWASIVPLLDISVAQHLRRRAELQFLSLLPSYKTANAYDLSEMDSRVVHAKNLLHIINSTTYSITNNLPTSSNQSLAQDILTALNGMRLLLSNTQIMHIKNDLISKWIPLILSFITVHTSEFEATRTGHECRAKATLALSAILLELQALELNTQAINELMEQIFDLALHLVDALPDDIRQQCVRSLRDAVYSPQMCYLFSYATNPSEWLVLSQKESMPNIPASSGPDVTEKRMPEKEKLTPFVLRRWEMLGEPTPNIGENDTSLNLTLFGARRG
ncbi:RNA polymerase-like protein II mediator complex component Srb8 [Tricladium varicosporioides]|nr:RNA polymerase-like protein II mediator complex component Srb8 [Hymenoscyphus varicosporioides]